MNTLKDEVMDDVDYSLAYAPDICMDCGIGHTDFDVSDILMPVQTHTCNVAVATSYDEIFPDTDALVTMVPGLRIGVRTADCVPVCLYAPDIHAVAAIHAGWKGTLGGIVDRTLEVMTGYGADPALMRAIFGASVCQACYEIDESLASVFKEAGWSDFLSYPVAGGRPHLDLQGINAERLIRGGLADDHIRRSADCTLHTCLPDSRHRYHSWRRKPGTTLRNYTSICIRQESISTLS